MRPRIVFAPDSFKGCATAAQVCEALAVGLRRVLPHADLVFVPMADGGEGTVQSLVDATNGSFLFRDVTGPLGSPVRARFGILGDGATAVLEMASASGLTLVPPSLRNPGITTTRGTGELIQAALEEGCRKLILGLGGSATNDGGAGMAQALGVRLLEESGRELPSGGLALKNLARIDTTAMAQAIADLEVVVACDVSNPLCGPTGASAIYGPQKGATPEMVEELDAALSHYAEILQRDLGREVKDVPGAGAAGGLGAGLLAFLNARLRRGVEIVMEAVSLEPRLAEADLVITGEGSIDGQTAFGKTVSGVASAAKRFGVPVIAIAGTIQPGAEALIDNGVDAFFAIVDRPMSLEEAMSQALPLLEKAGERMMRLVRIRLDEG